jgi:hypothetical protein
MLMIRNYINFILFTPCIVDNQITTFSPTKHSILFPYVLYYNKTYGNNILCFVGLNVVYLYKLCITSIHSVRKYKKWRTAKNRCVCVRPLYYIIRIRGLILTKLSMNVMVLEATPDF